MKLRNSTLALISLSSLTHAQTTVTLDGASGSQSYSVARTTDGGLTIGLGLEVEYLVVAGGGGGAGSANDSTAWGGGGGGAGGVLAGSTFLTTENFTVSVGAGGAGGSLSSNVALQQGSNGGNSSFSNLTAIGGGGGGAYKVQGNAGGSGGGGGGRGTGNNLRTAGGLGTPDQGNNGGSSRDDNSNGRSAGGGGGGAGGPGGTGGTDVTVAGNGGAGLPTNITGLPNVWIAGGGGGGARDTNSGAVQTPGTGGIGGGGAGSITGNGFTASPNSGSGGGGAGTNGAGGNGGSGMVIVRYKGSALGENIGGIVTSGIESAAGYTLHNFTTVGSSNLDLSGINLNSRLGVVENGSISGSGDLTFTGPGTLTLNAANSYSGLTRINAGTLALGSAASIANSSGISIADGANFNVSTVTGGFVLGATQNLSGGGTITGNVSIAGSHTPGFSPGIQSFENDLAYTTGSSITWELTDARVDEAERGIIYDGIDVAGNLSFAENVTLLLDFTSLGSFVDWRDAYWETSITGTAGWKIFDIQGTTTGFENLNLAPTDWLDSGSNTLSSFRPDASFSLYQAEDAIYLNYNAIPEPSSALLIALTSGALLVRRRK